MVTTAEQSETVLRIRRRFPATRERLYRAWTDPDQIRKWHAPGEIIVADAEIDLRVGGRYRYTMKSVEKGITYIVSGAFREVEPNQRLVYTWQWEAPEPGPETLVTVEFMAHGEESELSIVHERFPAAEMRDHHNEGWNGCFDKLEKLVHLYQLAPGISEEPSDGSAIRTADLARFYIEQMDFSIMARKTFFLSNVSDEESLYQPREDIPPIAWHVAHLANSEATIFLGMCQNRWDRIRPEWREWYKMGAKVSEYIKKLPPLSEILPEADRLHAECVEFVRTIDEEDLPKRLPFRRDELIPEILQTNEDCLRTLPLHDGHHNGEISLLRRLMKKKNAF